MRAVKTAPAAAQFHSFHPKTGAILEKLALINVVPRPSRGEEMIIYWLEHWASRLGLERRRDDAGNLVVGVPATAGREHEKPLALQAHVDMVCEKTPGSAHDFKHDPIEQYVDGEWLRARDTTLGADNGVAIAMMMEAAEDKSIAHGPLELVFTVDEETGLTGAAALSAGFVRSRVLLNLDSEDEGVFTIGCAGGQDARLILDFSMSPAENGLVCVELGVSGCRGGHSGVDIHRGRANAIVMLSRALEAARAIGPMRLIALAGGNAHNAIPREAVALAAMQPDGVEAARDAVEALNTAARAEFAATDPNLVLRFSARQEAGGMPCLTCEHSLRSIDLLLALPHGISAMDARVPALVETSNNLAMTSLNEGILSIVTSQRSSVPSRLKALTRRIQAMGGLAGAVTGTDMGYPPWPPDWDAPLVARCKDVYLKTFGAGPKIETVHAGLECAVIGAQIPGMRMISFGPTIEGAHSPDERLHIPSVGRAWDLLVALLKENLTD